MEEGPKTFTPKELESIKETRKRLCPIFDRSFELQKTSKANLWEGSITVTRRLPYGGVEPVGGLVCVGINEDGPELAWIDDEGKLTASATMPWEEIIDAKI